MITSTKMIEILKAIAEKIEAEKDYLTELDKEVFYYTEDDAVQLDGIKRAYIREAIITELP